MILAMKALIRLSLLITATSAAQYTCLPYPEKSMCLIDYIYYRPGGEEPISFSAGYDHYRIISRSEKQFRSNVTAFDAYLFEAMHRPARIEMANIRMQSLLLPPDLQLGIFAENSLSSVVLEVGQNYQIAYLDLESNNLNDITFVSALLNLEILHLESNHLSTIPGSAFAPLTKLKYLYLQYNSFRTIPWPELPHSLVHLDFFYGYMESVNFTNVSLPSLEYLGLQYNVLSSINVSALLAAAPQLKEAHLLNEVMTEQEMEEIKTTLRLNNVSFVDAPWLRSYCFDDEFFENRNGKCVPREPSAVSTHVAILLSGMVFVLAALFVDIVLFTFRHMNR